MQKGKVFCFFILLFFVSSICNGQADSSSTLSYREYIENIVLFHPVAKMANLKSKFAEAEWMSSKGYLDPVLKASWLQKELNDKLYYRQYQGKLKIPTKLGIDFVGGYERNDGTFLNPENKTDKFGLWNVGIEVNVLQGLITNERRTAISQARIFQNLANNEQQIIINDLLFTASFAYLQWQLYVHSQEVLSDNIDIAQIYFNNTKRSFFGGEKTAMDTLESFIMHQDAIIRAQKNNLNLIISKQQVENFLWFNDIPMQLETSVMPENFRNPIFNLFGELNIANPLLNHPIISAKENKQSYLRTELKLKREKLKPKLKIKYNPLLSTSENSISPSYSTTDYKWGVDFSMPLFLRTERAAIQKGNLKLQDIALDIENKKNQFQNKLDASRLKQVVLRKQLDLLAQNVEGYELLLLGENEKYKYGESSVFLLNKRQEKFINGKLKLIQLQIKSQNELLRYLYYSNGLALE